MPATGSVLKEESLAVTVGDYNIAQLTNLSVKRLMEFFRDIRLSERQLMIGKQILREIRGRIGFLNDVGLDYLSLSQATGTLSGGEAQRIRLATQIGSGLVGVAYILDEPSIGLHQRDNDKLIHALKVSGIWEILSLWWSTTRIRCWRQIISWISVRKPESMAAKWSPRERRKS